MATSLPLWWAMAGTALGAVMRLWLTRLLFPFSRTFPVATLLVNLSGALLAGMAAGISLHTAAPLWPALALAVLGGYTTVSSFSLQTLDLWHQRRPLAALINAGASLAGTLLACTAGLMLGGAW